MVCVCVCVSGVGGLRGASLPPLEEPESVCCAWQWFEAPGPQRLPSFPPCARLHTQVFGQGLKKNGVERGPLPSKIGSESWRSEERRRELVPLLKQEIRGRDEQGNVGHPHTRIPEGIWGSESMPHCRN